MTISYIFLTLIVLDLHNPKVRINVFLQTLIDEQKILWENGVMTYDIFRKKNFEMNVALLWTINDFSVYEMLSWCSMIEKLAFLYYMDLSKAFTLKNKRKKYLVWVPLDFPPSWSSFSKEQWLIYKKICKKEQIATLIEGQRLIWDYHYNAYNYIFSFIIWYSSY